MRSIRQRVRDVQRRLIQQYGTSGLKRRLWDAEFSSDRWANLDSTTGDFLYPLLRKHAAGGSILDLGCGSGNTACEAVPDTYSHYTGVDISVEALAKARARAQEQGRGNVTEYFQGDVITYQCVGRYDVILLRDSIYYVPLGRVREVLARYAGHLTATGALIVRMYDSGGKYHTIVRTIEKNFEVIEKHLDASNAVVLVFRLDAGGMREGQGGRAGRAAH